MRDKRVGRIWRREGLEVPSKQPKRGRLRLNDGSSLRLRAKRANHISSYDFVEVNHTGFVGGSSSQGNRSTTRFRFWDTTDWARNALDKLRGEPRYARYDA